LLGVAGKSWKQVKRLIVIATHDMGPHARIACEMLAVNHPRAIGSDAGT